MLTQSKQRRKRNRLSKVLFHAETKLYAYVIGNSDKTPRKGNLITQNESNKRCESEKEIKWRRYGNEVQQKSCHLFFPTHIIISVRSFDAGSTYQK